MGRTQSYPEDDGGVRALVFQHRLKLAQPALSWVFTNFVDDTSLMRISPYRLTSCRLNCCKVSL